jgi:uncharacterized Zn finger protein (UPF0148 family)
MSEDFDKEAERERLREKYESDQDERSSTERMSELLLQGATMTNKHCDTCGSPIFRYQGQEFCPTCQAEAQAAADQETGTPAQRAESQPAQEAAEQPEAETQPEAAESAPIGASTGGAESETMGAGEPTGPSRPQPSRRETPAGTTAGESPREALSETITALATRARQTEDPQQAQALLAAAREAAEALSALGTGR